MSSSNIELLARLIMCEAGGEGDIGMKAVASVVMNRVNSAAGEYSRISQGGDIRNIVLQKNQFTCALEYVSENYNNQSIFNMSPNQLHYDIADWVICGNRINEVGDCLWFMNPGKTGCPNMFPSKSGSFHTRINNHCFFAPTPYYAST